MRGWVVNKYLKSVSFIIEFFVSSEIDVPLIEAVQFSVDSGMISIRVFELTKSPIAYNQKVNKNGGKLYFSKISQNSRRKDFSN